jgi:hypothetical protein
LNAQRATPPAPALRSQRMQWNAPHPDHRLKHSSALPGKAPTGNL